MKASFSLEAPANTAIRIRQLVRVYLPDRYAFAFWDRPGLRIHFDREHALQTSVPTDVPLQGP